MLLIISPEVIAQPRFLYYHWKLSSVIFAEFAIFVFYVGKCFKNWERVVRFWPTRFPGLLVVCIPTHLQTQFLTQPHTLKSFASVSSTIPVPMFSRTPQNGILAIAFIWNKLCLVICQWRQDSTWMQNVILRLLWKQLHYANSIHYSSHILLYSQQSPFFSSVILKRSEGKT